MKGAGGKPFLSALAGKVIFQGYVWPEYTMGEYTPEQYHLAMMCVGDSDDKKALALYSEKKALLKGIV